MAVKVLAVECLQSRTTDKLSCHEKFYNQYQSSSRHRTHNATTSGQCKMKTADCGLGVKMRTEGKMQSTDQR